MKFIIIFRELLVTQMNHWGFFSIFSMLLFVLCHNYEIPIPSAVPTWLMCGFIPLGLYFARRYLTKFYLLLLAHMAAILYIFILPVSFSPMKILTYVTVIAYVIYSLYIWSKVPDKQDPKFYPLITVGASAICLAIIDSLGFPDQSKTFITIIILYLGIYFIVYYIEQYLNFLKVNKSSAGHIPARKMFQSGMLLASGYTLAGLALMLLISNPNWLGRILNAIRYVFVSFLNWFFSLFPERETEYIPYEDQSLQQLEDMGMYEGGESYWFWSVLEDIFVFILSILLLLAIIKLLMTLAKFIKSRLGVRETESFASSEENVIDVHEKCSIEKEESLLKKLNLLPKDTVAKIRGLYKKRVTTSAKQITGEQSTVELKRYTARESGTLLEREQMARIYEKARYSNRECTAEDLKEMRNACK